MMAFFNGKKKSKWLLATILAITLIATYALPMTVFADDAVPPTVQEEKQDLPADLDLEGDGADASTSSIPAYQVSLNKSVRPGTASPGDTVTYTFKVTNEGYRELKNVVVTDLMFGADWTLGFGKVSPWETETLTYNYLIPTNQAIGTLTNEATVTGDNGLSGEFKITRTDTDTAKLEIKAPYAIELEKSVDKKKASPGDEVTYKFKVTNTGTKDLHNVTLTDDLFGSDWEMDLGTIKAGKSTPKPIEVEYVIPTNQAIGVLTNTATVTGDNGQLIEVAVVEDDTIPQDGASISVSATDSADLTVAPKYALTLVKTATPATASPGDEVTYKFEVTNTGTRDLDKVVVTDPMFGNHWKIDFRSLDSGATETAKYKYQIPADTQFGTLTNTATVTGQIEDWCRDNNASSWNWEDCYETVATATATADVNVVPQYAITLDKTAPATAEAGDEVTYNFTIKNVGSRELKNVVLTDSKLGDGWSQTIVSLAAGASQTYSANHVIPADTPSDTDYINIAQVVAEYKVWQEKKPVSVSCYGEWVDKELIVTDSAVIVVKPEVPPLYEITLEKTVSPSAVVPGETVQYSFKVKNTGNQTLYDVVLTDPMFGTENNFLAWIGTGAVLEPGVEETYVKDYVVPADYTGTELTNTATVTGFYEDYVIKEYGDGIFDWINGEGEGSSWLEENSVQATDSAIVTVSQGEEPNPPNRTRRTGTTTITEPVVPAAPVEAPVTSVIAEEIPAAPLPATGGVAPYLLYGFGLLLAGGGAAIKTRNKK